MLRMFCLACFLVFLVLPPVCAGWWDDFSNNLATDLAPLISLFGEQVTKQYLSESTNWLDYFIFAMAPMGILTAVVSAIRVCGSPSLRAFIGRAQEGGGNAEAELCSSTSRDVCELYNNGGIARVFGRPKILELVYDPGEPCSTKQAGIYTFHDYVKSKSHNVWSRVDETGLHKASTDEEATTPEPAKTKADTDTEPFAPNLSLNVGIKRNSPAIFWAVAVAGLILQTGVLVFAGISTYYLRWETRGDSPPPYACPLVIIGTLFLCAGIFFCAFLVGESTQEQVFRKLQNGAGINPAEASRPAGPCIIWVQPGGQVLGDQTFDSFCYNDRRKPLQEYIISRKKPTRASEYAVWMAVGVTLSGFVLQFVGFRAIHSGVSVAQLGVILAMSVARASLRTQRLKLDDNLFAKFPDKVVGHELDWLALNMDQDTPSKQVRDPFWRFCGIPKERKIACPSGKNDLTDYSANPAGKIFVHRTRLAQLTESLADQLGSFASTRNFRIQMVDARLEAQRLSVAIEFAINTLFSSGFPVKLAPSNDRFWWAIRCSYFTYSSKEEARDTVYLKICRNGDHHWTLDNTLELESLLGLWTWSLTSDRLVSKEDQSSLERSRAAEVPMRRIVSTNENVGDLNVWLEGDISNFDKYILEPGTTDSEPGSLWKRRIDSNYVPLSGNLPEDLEDSPVLRFFGRHTWLAQVHGSQPISNIEVRSARIGSSLLSACAQEIFGSFIASILDIMDMDKIGNVGINEDGESFHLENKLVSEIVKSFTESQLGSRKEALLCILPSILPVLPLPSAQLSLTAAKKSANAHRKRKAWTKAEEVLKWAWIVCTKPQPREETRDSMEDLTIQAAIALGELYRWALRDKDAKDIGKIGINWLQQQNSGRSEAWSNVVNRYNDIQERLDQQNDDGNGDELRSAITNKDLTATLLFLTRPVAIPRNEKGNALCFAAKEKWPEVVLALLELSTEPDFKDHESRTALSHAAESGNIDILKELIEWGAFPNGDDNTRRTPLSYASEKGNTFTVQILLNNERVFPDSNDNEKRTPLWWAAANGHKEIVELLIGTGQINVNATDIYGQTLLFQAAANGHKEIIELFIGTGQINIDATDIYGQTPLFQAAANGHKEIIELFIGTGQVNIDATDIKKQTPLSYAAENGRKEIVELLIGTRQVNVNATDINGQTPLSQAAGNGHKEIIKLFIRMYQINVNATNIDGRTPLWQAAANGHKEIVNLLIRTDQINIDATDIDGRTPLWQAAANGHKEIVELLIGTSQVNIDATDINGQRPLSQAAGNGHKEIVELLIGTGQVNVNATDINRQTPLWHAAGNGHKEIVELLIGIGQINGNATDTDGRTPLCQTAANGYKEIVELLIETGKINVNAIDNKGRTPLWYAAANGYKEIVELLIGTGQINGNATNIDGRTPLSQAAGNGHKEIVELLIGTSQVNIDATDIAGQTPLSYAAEYGHKEIVELLIGTGQVNVDATDIDGQTPLSYAAEHGYEEIVELLQFYSGINHLP